MVQPSPDPIRPALEDPETLADAPAEPPPPVEVTLLEAFFDRMRGGAPVPAAPNYTQVAWSALGALVGMGACGALSSTLFEPYDQTLLIGSFGASAVLVYAAIHSPLAQPRNVVGGHLLSGLVGVACYMVLGASPFASALSVSAAIAVMMLTRTLHPPGGATALIAVIGGPEIHDLGFLYAIVPAALGAAVLVAVALVVNNVAPGRRYPEYW